MTRREFEQLKVAIEAMHCVDINDRKHVDMGNVVVIMERWIDPVDPACDGVFIKSGACPFWLCTKCHRCCTDGEMIFDPGLHRFDESTGSVVFL